MTNEDLSRRTSFFAEHGLPYSEKVWYLLSVAWRNGCAAGNEGSNPFDDNPFRDGSGLHGEELAHTIIRV